GSASHLLGAARASDFIAKAPQVAMQPQEGIQAFVTIRSKKSGFGFRVVVELLPMTEQTSLHGEAIVVAQDSPQGGLTGDALVVIAPVAAFRTSRQEGPGVDGELDRAGHTVTGNILKDRARGDRQEFTSRGEIEGPAIHR